MQYNKVKNNNKYRQVILNQIKEYIDKNQVNEFIIGEDFNQSIESNK